MAARLLWACALALLLPDLTSEAQIGLLSFLPFSSRSVDLYEGFEDGHFSEGITNQTRWKRQSKPCGSRTFTCDNGKCINIELKCDGSKDCTDGSDETFKVCKSTKCDSFLTRCDYGACVGGDAKCNNVVECADASDEKYCNVTNVPKPNKCGPNFFQCDNGDCKHRSSKCDGIADCSDGSDETFAVCGSLICEEYLFVCDYGACIDEDKRCNEVIDCADGSDENRPECPNSVATTPRPIVTQKPPKTTPTPKVTPKPPVTIDPRDPSVSGCIVPPPPEDGRYTASNFANIKREGDIVDVDYVLEIRCRDRYSVVGNKFIKCQQNHNWDSAVPECKRDCKRYDVYSVDVTCNEKGEEVPCGEFSKHGTVMTSVCKTGHTNNYLPANKCIDGSWEYAKPYCRPRCGEPTGVGVGMALGGKIAQRGKVPWHAVIYQTSNEDPAGYSQICGGTIISNLLVISAGHCFYDNDKKALKSPDLYLVAVSKFYRQLDNKDDEDHPHMKITDVEKIFVSQYYSGDATSEQADMAILKLSETLTLNQFVVPICLNLEATFSRNQLSNGAIGRVAGMGLTSEGGKPSEQLLYVDLPWIDINECKGKVPESFHRYLTPDKFCAGYLNGTSVCSGDSGGGLAFESKELRQWFLQGIVSTGVPSATFGRISCRNDTYSAFTKIISHASWIAEYVEMYK